MNQQYQWPDPLSIYPDREGKSYVMKRFRFHLRSFWHRKLIDKFTQFVNQQSPQVISFLTEHPDYSYPLVHRFLDKRLTGAQRLQAISENLLFLPQKSEEVGLPSLWSTPICFGEVIPDFILYLQNSQHQPMEGFWTLELCRKEDKEPIYLLTFGKIEQGLLIAVIQGPNIEGSKEIVKQLTKKAHGLRPAYFMVEAMKALTSALGYQKLFGIPQRYQNKSRFVQSKNYVVNYDVIFQESNGILGKYWDIPLTIENKDMDNIPSNKRSMYRKRYSMLEQLAQEMQQIFNKLD